MSRHDCAHGGWPVCSACRGRIHLAGCTTPKRADVDCCKARHVALARLGFVMGIDDAAVPMVDEARPSYWREE